MLSFAQDYEQCRTAFLRETEYKNVEGLRDDLYYACILFGTGTPEYRAVGNAVLENANWHACPYSGLPAVQLLTEHGDMLSAGAREKLLSFLRQGQAGWCAELKRASGTASHCWLLSRCWGTERYPGKTTALRWPALL